MNNPNHILSASTLTEIFEFSPTATAIFDQETGHCLDANRSFKAQLGIPHHLHDVQKVNFSQLFHNQEQADEFISNLKERTIVRREEAILIDLDRRAFTALVSGRLLDSSADQSFEFSFVDIHRLKNIQRKLKRDNFRINSAIDNLPVGLFLVNQSGRVTEANLTLANALQMEQESLINLNADALFNQMISMSVEPEALQKEIRAMRLEIPTHPITEAGFQQNDQIVFYEISLFPVYSSHNRTLGWGGLIQDISALRDQSEWKLSLLSTLAHGIRSPLATIKGHSTALLANHTTWSADMRHEFLEAIDGSTDELIHLVDRHLALTRVETGSLGLRPEAVSPQQLIEQALERAATILETIHVTEEIAEELSEVRADPARIEEVLMILLENAVTHGANPRGVLIGADEKNDHIWFFVQDYGKGLSSAQQNLILSNSKPPKSADGSQPTGLYIARKIAEAHGGILQIDSPLEGEGNGARFSISVPVMPPIKHIENKDAYSPKILEISDSKRLAILVVDAQEDYQTLYPNILPSNRFEIEIASNGTTALDLAQVLSPDLILLDLKLPDMDGLSVCRQLRRWTDSPLIVVTSRTSKEDMISALDIGADDYLVKPFSSDALLARINAVMRRGESYLGEKSVSRFNHSGLVIDYETREAWKNGIKLHLTATEFDLLAYFSKNIRRTLTYSQLIQEIWGGHSSASRHALSVHISRLRKKIETNSEESEFIVTKWGVGYIFLPDAD